VSADGRPGTAPGRSRCAINSGGVSGAALRARLSQGVLGPVRELGGGRYEGALRARPSLPRGRAASCASPRARRARGDRRHPGPPRPGRLLLGLRWATSTASPRCTAPAPGYGANPSGSAPCCWRRWAAWPRRGSGWRERAWSSESTALVVPMACAARSSCTRPRAGQLAAGPGRWPPGPASPTTSRGPERVGLRRDGVASAALQLGPGQAFLELSYAWAPCARRPSSCSAAGWGWKPAIALRVF
jgi:hypothetical protein